MESNTTNSIFNFELNETSKSNLEGIAQWAKITSIVGFISVGLSLLSSIYVMSKVGSGTNISTSLVGWGISIMLNVILLGVSKSLLTAVVNTDQASLNKGFSDLAKYLRIIGILCIVIGAIFVIVLLVVLAMGAVKGFR